MDEYFKDINELQSVIEAIFFTSGEPVSLSRLYEIFNIKGSKDENKKKKMIEKSIVLIRDEFNEKDIHGIFLSINADNFSFKTKVKHFIPVSEFLRVKPQKFTKTQLETLAIIAYKQPLIKSEIEQIRGVDSGWVLKFLLERNLIKIAGRKDIIGKPLIYKTTDFFLEVFNLKSLNELPSIKEVEEVLENRNKELIEASNHNLNNLNDPKNDKNIIGPLFE